MNMRPYQAADAAILASIQKRSCPSRPHNPARFNRRLTVMTEAGGGAWVIVDERSLLGYAAVAPVPGLAGVMELEGFVDPGRRRQGVGSQLLAYVIRQITDAKRAPKVRSLSHCVNSLEDPAARFLQHHGFTVEHEEWVMTLTDLASHLDVTSTNEMIHLETFRRKAAVKRFCALYHQSFAGCRWYQPYTAAEVAATLETPADLLFLHKGERPIGFVWARRTGRKTGEIEPIGVIKPQQGQGYGRLLLQAGLNRLAEQGIREAKIGAWRDNRAAIHLYQSFGFRHSETLTYLAYGLENA